MKNKEVKISIWGDICPTKDTQNLMESGGASTLLGDTQTLITQSDFSLCNVEFPMSDHPTHAKKTGPVLGAKTSAIDFFSNAGFDLLSLANNHIKDYGEQGVKSTLKVAQDANLPTVGAGLTLEEAKRGYVKQLGDITLGVMAFAEQEFNIASSTSAGANYLDPYTDFERIQAFKDQVDYLIVLYHGGIEYYEYPSPLLQKKCRKLVESGADFVTCQHSHIIGARESYLDGEILYGQGNSVFGYREGKPTWNQGLVAAIALSKTTNGTIGVEISYMPITAHTRGGIQLIEKKERDVILHTLHTSSSKLDDQKFLTSQWNAFCSRQADLVIPQLLGYNRWLIHLNRLTKGLLVKIFFTQKKMMVTHNLIRCEAHHEVVKTILKDKQTP